MAVGQKYFVWGYRYSMRRSTGLVIASSVEHQSVHYEFWTFGILIIESRLLICRMRQSLVGVISDRLLTSCRCRYKTSAICRRRPKRWRRVRKSRTLPDALRNLAAARVQLRACDHPWATLASLMYGEEVGDSDSGPPARVMVRKWRPTGDLIEFRGHLLNRPTETCQHAVNEQFV